MIIGLTGGIASGKTTVARMLRDLGAKVLDADQIAKEVVKKGSDSWRDIVDTFGKDVLDEQGEVNRPVLAKIVFNDETLRQKLNRIIHPRVIASMELAAKEYLRTNPDGIVIYDVPLLIETGMHRLVDEVWVVKVDDEIQLRRVMERDKISLCDALSRIKAQMPLSEKLKYADRVIDTGVSLEDTRRQVLEYWADLMR